MPWYRIILTLFAAWMLAGCASGGMQSAIPIPSSKALEAEYNKTAVDQMQRLFAAKRSKNLVDENETKQSAYLLCALTALGEKNLSEAKYCFEKLYDVSKQSRILVELININSHLGEHEKNTQLLQNAILRDQTNIDLKRLLAANYIQTKEYEKAKELANEIAKTGKRHEDYDMSANLYYLSGDFKNAVKNLKIAYSIKPQETYLDRMATIMFSELDKKNEAIALYETHIRLYGCSKFICERLMTAHQEMGNVKAMQEISKKMYFKFKDQKSARKTIELYLTGGDMDGLALFLEKTSADDKTLLEVYKLKKAHAKAAKLAMSLFKKTGNYDYLALNAIFTFEAAGKKASHRLVKSTVDKLTKAVSHVDNDIYYNYLGYLLIDYDIDVQRGIELVSMALAKNAESPYYLDSLAWGLYKQKKCREAKEIMDMKYFAEVMEDESVMEHLNAINKCIKKESKGR